MTKVWEPVAIHNQNTRVDPDNRTYGRLHPLPCGVTTMVRPNVLLASIENAGVRAYENKSAHRKTSFLNQEGSHISILSQTPKARQTKMWQTPHRVSNQTRENDHGSDEVIARVRSLSARVTTEMRTNLFKTPITDASISIHEYQSAHRANLPSKKEGVCHSYFIMTERGIQ